MSKRARRLCRQQQWSQDKAKNSQFRIATELACCTYQDLRQELIEEYLITTKYYTAIGTFTKTDFDKSNLLVRPTYP